MMGLPMAGADFAFIVIIAKCQHGLTFTTNLETQYESPFLAFPQPKPATIQPTTKKAPKTGF